MILLKRKIHSRLKKWKEQSDRIPLVIIGAHQVGKTTSIKSFAKKNYKYIVEVNFAKEELYCGIFDNGFNVDTIINNILFINPKFEFAPQETLIYFDDIQCCSKCIDSLELFKNDSKYDVICSGSYLSDDVLNKEFFLKYKMYSLDFEEFLWAKGYKKEDIDCLLKHMIDIEPFTEIEYHSMSKAFQEYILLGGMPEVVASFIRNGNFDETLEIQKRIISYYKEYINKYATKFEAKKILEIYEKIPFFLTKEKKKFVISNLKKSARYREYSDAIKWLIAAGIARRCDFTASPSEYTTRENIIDFKLYFSDNGLLVGSLYDSTQTDLLRNKEFGANIGALYENVVADTFGKLGYSLHYFKNHNGNGEIHFSLRNNRDYIPIKLKTNNNTNSSLRKYADIDSIHKKIKYGVLFGFNNIDLKDNVYILPYFTAFLIKKFINERFKETL